ncbi:hypothetical protein Achl_4359 (plasmid) [Pseudarthrobacter chlorophenolicus A6]|uniref:Integral membrane protein n=1 Tax=Pseudarthrobacter chlorophenolicus (strain ATCC 700700 / DSM 12829 / CIP 107037 / JCM 12360 / KCTC 9906 / NCIMB 13794 / A6) TaxID=452863 RepID=B8HIR3_PSECP|nr:hypothetical protein [Pseudarthrobacter chlorophenolicus]ACL42310.1 hypothetical protein Achl_4359 [Pseudarthrobacter chlorophenolicus A6]SDQ16319.1 hypothetical protein SAMN04489738_0416 [Pseudarthrobacter chlorophenolicus]
MSILRPKDGDYIGRGLLLFIGWVIVGWLPFAVIGALLAGAGGATIGFVASIPVGVVLYGAYLRLDPAAYPRRS